MIGHQRLLVGLLHGLALLLLGLHLYVRTLPPTQAPIPQPGEAEFLWWGLWPATYAPGWSVWAGSLLVIGTIAAFWLAEWRGRTGVRPGPTHDEADAGSGRGRMQTGFAALIGVSFLLVIGFFAFPIVHTRWGDAYMISRAMAWPDPALRLTHSWQAPLDVFLHSRLWLWLHQAQAWQDDATGVYRWLSPLAGLLFLLVTLALSRLRSLAPGWLTYGLLVSLGVMQLFFGYVENYSFAAVGILAYLWLGLRLLQGDGRLWITATVLAVTHATHPSTIVLAPSLLYLGWEMGQRRNQSWPRIVLEIGAPMLLVAGATVLLMEAGGHGIQALLTSDRPGGGDARWLVPLFETTTRWEQYTMFSWPHLRDWLNQQLLVAPVVLPSLLILGIYQIVAPRHDQNDSATDEHRWTRIPIVNLQSPICQSSIRFLAVASLFYLLFTWMWNPDYGGQRDWDLFSLAALPVALWLIALAPRVLASRYLAMGMVPLILLQAFHTAGWIYQNTLPWQWP